MSQAQVFQTFNEQLACISQAGVPMEEGLRLIAHEVRSRRLRKAIDRVVSDLEQGADLAAAFEKHSDQFPELYHRVLQVGTRTGRMSQVLILFGRHLSLLEQLKRRLWQAASYPLICLVALLLIAIFLAVGPIPVLTRIAGDPRLLSFTSRFTQPGSHIPDLSGFVIDAALVVPWICGLLLLVLALTIPTWWLLGRLGKRARFTDSYLARLPLLGPVLWRSALARWCDALYIATDAGLDLPQSIDLAGKLVAWNRIQQDSSDMVRALAAGQPLQNSVTPTWRVIPPSVRTALQLASERNDLPNAAKTLGEVYQHEAESRAAAISAILSPLLLLAIAFLILVVLGGLMAPIVRIFQSLT